MSGRSPEPGALILLTGALPVGLAFVLLWQIPFKAGAAMIVYYLIVTVLFNTSFSFVSIPYNALMPEMSQNYDERTQISGYRMAFSFLGNLLAAAGVALIVDSLYPGKNSYPVSYPVMGVIFGVVTTILILLTYFGTKERVKSEPEPVQGGIFGALKTLWQVREMRLAIGLFTFNQIAADLFMTIVIFFIKDVMLVPDDLTFVIMGIPLLAILLAPPGNIPVIIVIAVLAGIGTSATQVLPWSILPDVVEFDEYQNGVRREGMFFGITIFMYKVASAIAVGLATTVLGIFGYVENAAAGAQPHSAVVAVRLLLGFGPAAFMLMAALFARVLPLSKERFNEIKRLIEERKIAKGASQPA